MATVEKPIEQPTGKPTIEDLLAQQRQIAEMDERYKNEVIKLRNDLEEIKKEIAEEETKPTKPVSTKQTTMKTPKKQ